jgi:cytochrome P450
VFTSTERSSKICASTRAQSCPVVVLPMAQRSRLRDEAVFEDAQRLEVLRATDANHLGFGFGRHFCLGAHARMEICAFYRELLGRLDNLELVTEPTWVRANFVQGPRTMPVAYSLRS